MGPERVHASKRWTHDIIKGSACPKRGKTGRKGSVCPNSRPEGVHTSKRGTHDSMKGSACSKKGQNGQEGVDASKKGTNSRPKGVGVFKKGMCYGQKESPSPKSGLKGTHDIIKGLACPKRGKTGRKGLMRPKKGQI